MKPKLASWSATDSDDGVPDMSEEIAASHESRRRAALRAEGWIEGPDRLWRKSLVDAEWLPKCEIGYVTHAVVEDRSSGVTIHDTAGSTHFDCSRLPRAFRTPRDVDMVVEFHLAEDPSAQPLSWEETELCPREASEYRAAAAARLNYLALDRPDILFASNDCLRRMPVPPERGLGSTQASCPVSSMQAAIGLEVCLAEHSKVNQRIQ